MVLIILSTFLKSGRLVVGNTKAFLLGKSIAFETDNSTVSSSGFIIETLYNATNITQNSSYSDRSIALTIPNRHLIAGYIYEIYIKSLSYMNGQNNENCTAGIGFTCGLFENNIYNSTCDYDNMIAFTASTRYVTFSEENIKQSYFSIKNNFNYFSHNLESSYFNIFVTTPKNYYSATNVVYDIDSSVKVVYFN